MTIKVAILFFVLCSHGIDAKKCEKYLNDCVTESKNWPLLEVYRLEYRKVYAVTTCAKRGGYLK